MGQFLIYKIIWKSKSLEIILTWFRKIFCSTYFLKHLILIITKITAINFLKKNCLVLGITLKNFFVLIRKNEIVLVPYFYKIKIENKN